MNSGSIAKVWEAARTHPLLQHIPGAADRTAEVALRVTGGLHAGASLDLDQPVYTIGSSTESDVVLRDPGIEPVHARLRRNAGRMELEAVGGDIRLANGDIVPKGHGRRCRLPLEISVGAARVLLTGPRQPAASRGIPGQPAWIAGGLVVIALFIVGTSLSLAGPEGSGQGVGLDEKLTRLAFADGIQKYAVTDAQGGFAAPQGPASASEAARRLAVQLAEAGIGGLDVEETGGRLVVSGNISGQQVEAWTAVQSWFDQTHGGHVPLVSQVAAGGAEKAPRIPLQAIWYGQRPYIITADGARYYEGAFVSDGWTIRQIGEKELLLTKGGSTVALKYP